MVDMISVDSSNVKSIGYDEDTQELYVDFLNGSSYKYSGVPQSVFEDFQNASSKGQFLHYEIKGRYDYQKIY